MIKNSDVPAVNLDTPAAIRQSLADGPAGLALLQLVRAHAGTGTWADARAGVHAVATGPVDAGPHASLYYGAPAIGLLLHCAAQADDRYRPAAMNLDPYLLRLTRARLTTARARIAYSTAATHREYDLFHGLTGIGALLLHRAPGSDEFTDLLRYLTQMILPRARAQDPLPGWWVTHDPDPTLPTPGGHANLGMAHGAAGILALLALAMHHGHLVDGHAEAINDLTSWFARWQQTDTNGATWWPQWLTLDELHTGRISAVAPGRPSWCYGTPGIARALQLAAITTRNRALRSIAEQALTDCLTDRHLSRLTDLGLCHGLAGLTLTMHRAAADSDHPTLAQHLPVLTSALHSAIERTPTAPNTGLLTGNAGILLAAETIRHGAASIGWDTCLLIT
ncbi:lanthionine synthetase C family protein [Catenuloplanes indicus]|uniref:Lanthionine synthetase n=1 Tax=Catenuloplanes indicus TaxID=137267 RepID=A0AAE4AYN5_9ACTN|nr:lanthionine synthetase C family protein [Catenuloplanes indicus]MDQ0366946.1 hypothetical protein [Catenuloplanes indicus]